MNEDRRSHARANLHVPVLLHGGVGQRCIQTRTENVSKDGFFAYVEHPFALGDRIKFVLVLPAVSGDAETTAGVFVYGEVEVVRVNVGPPGSLCGIGCHLTTYRVLPASDWIVPEHLLERAMQEDFTEAAIGVAPRQAVAKGSPSMAGKSVYLMALALLCIPEFGTLRGETC